MKARWAKQYKRVKLPAHDFMKRKRRREEMAKRKTAAGHMKREASERSKKPSGISPEQYFKLRDGTAIKSVSELAIMMDSISDDDFSFHVNEEKNDFSNWISGVFGNNELAEGLLPLKDKKESQILLLKHAVSKGK